MLLCAGDDDEYCEESKLRAIAGGSATSLVVMNGSAISFMAVL